MGTKHRRRGGRKRRERKAAKSSSKSKLFKILDLFLRLLIYPGYVLYVFLKTVLIIKPKETVYSIKEKLSLSYYKSKKYYRKAKKFTLEDPDNGAEPTSDDDNDNGGASKSKLKKKKKVKMKLLKKIVMKFVMLIKKVWSLGWKLLVKVKSLKKYFVMKIKWTIKKLYEMWLDTERIVFKIKGLPFAIVEKIKSFVKDAIEEPDDNGYDYEIVPKSSKFPEPISYSEDRDADSVDELIITKTVTDWPDKSQLSRPSSSRALSQSRDRPQSHLSRLDMERIDGTHKYFSPPTNEELIDNYFNTFDAIQPHEAHRNSVARRRKRRVVTDEDIDAIDYVPSTPERPLTLRDVIAPRGSNDRFERDHTKPHVSFNE